jgi:hypothetical protein
LPAGERPATAAGLPGPGDLINFDDAGLLAAASMRSPFLAMFERVARTGYWLRRQRQQQSADIDRLIAKEFTCLARSSN